MPSLSSISLLIYLVFSLAACAPLTNVRATVETTHAVALPNHLLHAAAVRYAEEQGWSIDSSDEGLGWIEALSEVDESVGLRTRERWVFSTRDGGIGIQLHLEFHSKGVWKSNDLVCSGYSYYRENQHLSAIIKQARTQNVASLSLGASAAPQPGAY